MLNKMRLKLQQKMSVAFVLYHTLKRTQRNIIEKIEETLIIQQHGREERQLAEKELQQLEQDLKSHLVNIKRPNKQSKVNYEFTDNKKELGTLVSFLKLYVKKLISIIYLIEISFFDTNS